MNQTPYQPGEIWPARALTHQLLMAQWERELQHHSAGLSLSDLAFAENDWADLEWNARESVYLNSQWERAPKLFRHLFLPQDRINLHLIRAFQKLLFAWQQWIHLPHIKSLNTLPPVSQCSLIILTANKRLEQAISKYDSLASGKSPLNHITVRQQRFFQNMALLLFELDPLVTGAAAYGQSTGHENNTLMRLEVDVTWHSKEILVLAGTLARRPNLMDRLKAPRMELNRLLGNACIYQTQFLKLLIDCH